APQAEGAVEQQVTDGPRAVDLVAMHRRGDEAGRPVEWRPDHVDGDLDLRPGVALADRDPEFRLLPEANLAIVPHTDIAPPRAFAPPSVVRRPLRHRRQRSRSCRWWYRVS